MHTTPDTERDTARYTTSDPDETPATQPARSASKAGRAAATYDELKRRLLNGEFPLGHRMAEERLAVELGVSRTPVREALSRLSAEGLVERRSEGGYGPAAPDLHLARDLYEVRFALELDALARPGRLGATHDLRLVRELRSDWLDLAVPDPTDVVGPDFALLDEDYHVRLAAAAGNDALCDMLVRVNERIRPVRLHDFLTPGRIQRTIEQHLSIVDALLAGELRAARGLLESHFHESLAVAEERAAAALARMVTRHRRGTP